MRSVDTFEALPNHLLQAEAQLDQAEHYFAEHAYSPFWESIENAALSLGRFDAAIHEIATNFQEHEEVSRRLDSAPPAFPIARSSVHGMVAAATTNNRMRHIVRHAQHDFQFSVIYEQRRTSQILIAGFTSLGQALDGLGDRIESSISDLGKQIESVSSSLQAVSSSIGDVASAVDAQNKRHDKALEMLDNIQRRRIPGPRRWGDGAY